jgi:hypothetical protein
MRVCGDFVLPRQQQWQHLADFVGAIPKTCGWCAGWIKFNDFETRNPSLQGPWSAKIPAGKKESAAEDPGGAALQSAVGLWLHGVSWRRAAPTGPRSFGSVIWNFLSAALSAASASFTAENGPSSIHLFLIRLARHCTTAGAACRLACGPQYGSAPLSKPGGGSLTVRASWLP